MANNVTIATTNANGVVKRTTNNDGEDDEDFY